MTGIYKITNPNGKVYIGQSVNLKKRLNNYKNLKCEGQPALYRSLVKYGFENHEFKVIEYCDIEKLNERERYWQDFYNVLKNGLNCRLTRTDSKTGFTSDETKSKLSKALKGRVISKEQRIKLSIAGRGRKLNEKQRKAIIKSNTGRFYSEETRHKIAINNPTSKIILDLNSGVFYYSIADLARTIKINPSTLFDILTERRGYKNNTNYKIV